MHAPADVSTPLPSSTRALEALNGLTALLFALKDASVARIARAGRKGTERSAIRALADAPATLRCSIACCLRYTHYPSVL